MTNRNIPKLTPLSQPVTDERSVDPRHMTSEQISGLIYEPDHRETTIPALYWLIFIFSCLAIYYYWHLFIFIFITYKLLTFNNPSAVEPRDSQSFYSDFLFHYAFPSDHDAEDEGRIGHPTDEEIRLSKSVEIAGYIRLPNGTISADSNNVQPVNPIRSHENARVDGGIIINNDALPIQNHQNTLFNINHRNNAEDNVRFDQTNRHHARSAATYPSSNQVSEIEGRVNAPVQGVLRVTISIIDPAPTRITKASNSVRRNAAPTDESVSGCKGGVCYFNQDK